MDDLKGGVSDADATEVDQSEEEAQLPNNSRINSSECSLEGAWNYSTITCANGFLAVNEGINSQCQNVKEACVEVPMIVSEMPGAIAETCLGMPSSIQEACAHAVENVEIPTTMEDCSNLASDSLSALDPTKITCGDVEELKSWKSFIVLNILSKDARSLSRMGSENSPGNDDWFNAQDFNYMLCHAYVQDELPAKFDAYGSYSSENGILRRDCLMIRGVQKDHIMCQVSYRGDFEFDHKSSKSVEMILKSSYSLLENHLKFLDENFDDGKDDEGQSLKRVKKILAEEMSLIAKAFKGKKWQQMKAEMDVIVEAVKLESFFLLGDAYAKVQYQNGTEKLYLYAYVLQYAMFDSEIYLKLCFDNAIPSESFEIYVSKTQEASDEVSRVVSIISRNQDIVPDDKKC